MSEHKNDLRLPAAGILFILNPVVNLLFNLVSYGVRSLQAGLLPLAVSVLLTLFIGVVLLTRNRGGLLAAALTLGALWNAYNSYGSFYNVFMLSGVAYAWRWATYAAIADAAVWLLFIVFAFALTVGKNGGAAARLKNLWLLTALLIAFVFQIGTAGALLSRNAGWALFQALEGLWAALPYFLLCRWLADPYKKGRTAAANADGTETLPLSAGPQAAAAPAQAAARFCPACGAKLEPGSAFCINCGAPVSAPAQTPVQLRTSAAAQAPAPGDAPSGGFGVLGFFIPVVGLILYLVWKDETPLRAKSAGKGALAGVITWTALTILLYVIYFVLLGNLYSGLLS